ncbi:hypothetical protein PENSPDRAFT_663980 [Peniophora sp. CONT]|nr:hypothetical protein PENSPDRAFT_663980 [Peniophora sp. CONT]
MSTEVHTRDDLFYFHSVVFLAETKLFKVPRYGLPGDAAIFDSMFGQATGGAGSSDDNPIRLDADVAAADFRSLLKAAFPSPGTLTAVLTLDEWMGVLTLAKKWKLESMKDKAVAGSDILLAKSYTVAKWLKEGYCALASRVDPITVQERKARLGNSWTFGSADESYLWTSRSCGNNYYHGVNCPAGQPLPDLTLKLKDKVMVQWATFDFDNLVTKEFGAAVKV